MSKNISISGDIIGSSSIITETQYNQQMSSWASRTRQLAQMQAALFRKGKKINRTYRSGKKAGKLETKLRNHIQYNLIKEYGEASGIGFKFPVHGIFREYGVGNGTPRNMVGRTKRNISDWLSSTLDKNETDLINIVANYNSDKIIKTFAGVKK